MAGRLSQLAVSSLAMTAEERLAATEILLDEGHFDGEDQPDVGGVLRVESVDEGSYLRIIVRPGLAGIPRMALAEWAVSCFARLLQHGPSADGWLQVAGSRLELWARYAPVTLLAAGGEVAPGAGPAGGG
jgi:hypothetical protein